MKESFIHNTASIINCQYGAIKVYRNVFIKDSQLMDNISIGDDTVIERCRIEDNVSINRRSYFNDSEIGRFSYTGINTIMNYSKLGRFCSIGRNVDIGGFNHDYNKITTMSEERFIQLLKCKKPAFCNQEFCEIGNDVWIAAGAIVLHKVKIGDGAVIGAGAVVTKDVPPYSIVVGIPAKVIGYRCNEALIERLLKLRWWNLPLHIIKQNIELIMHKDISDETITMIESLKEDF